MRRPGRTRVAALGASFVVALFALGIETSGCRVQVSLGTPDDGGERPFVPSEAGPCPTIEANLALATLDAAMGELRALAAHGGVVVAALARADGAGSVVLLSTPRAGSGPVELARIGADPVSIAFDGAHAYVACQASAQVYRVRVDPDASEAGVEPPVVASLESSVTSVAVDERGRAFWTRPPADAVFAWSFDGGAPSIAATVPRAQSVAAHDGALYIAGSHALSVLAPGEAAPTKVADVCGGGALAIEGGAVVCIDDGMLWRIDLHTGAVTSLASGIRGARDVVAARGRAFFRAEGLDGAAIEAVPLDGIGGPTALALTRPGPGVIATDRCNLYYMDGSVLRRHAL